MTNLSYASSSLASSLSGYGWNTDFWALYTSGEVVVGSAFIYSMIILISAVATLICDFEDRQMRRLFWQDGIFEDRQAA